MKKLNEEEANKLKIKGKGPASHVFEALINLKSGEQLLIEPKDWKRKSSPSKLCRYIEKKYPLKFVCWSLKDNQGWLVKCI